MNNKLKSQRGASLTIALLLFLVCAVIGSVVLIAGTASTGRMSQLPESDQRYYSVTSAAQLLKEICDKQTVTFERVKTTTRTATTTITGSDAIGYSYGSVDTEDTVTYTAKLTGPEESDSKEWTGSSFSAPEQLLQYCAFKLACGDFAALADAYAASFPAITGEKTFKMTVKVIGKEALNVFVIGRVKRDGNIILTLSNNEIKDGVIPKDTFRFQMTLSADMKNDESRTETTAAPSIAIVDGTRKETVTSTIVEKKITTVTWEILRLEVLN